MTQKRRYSQFLAEKFETWARHGRNSDHWDRLLLAITPVIMQELRKEIKRKHDKNETLQRMQKKS